MAGALRVAAAAFLAGAMSATAAGLQSNATFQQYHQHLGRDYSLDSDEGEMRRRLFEERVALIQLQNSDRDAIWEAGLNHMTDRTEAELESMRGYAPGPAGTTPSLIQSHAARASDASDPDPPSYIDWSYLQSFSQVSDQRSCGSCWAFAATMTVRAHYELRTTIVRQFSVQHMVNCVENPNECGGQGGCKGATPQLGMQLMVVMGLEAYPLEEKEPYDGVAHTCASRSSSLIQSSLRGVQSHAVNSSAGLGVSLTGWAPVTRNSPWAMMQALIVGPQAISITGAMLFPYKRGIFDGCKGPKSWIVDHAVVMVGYGRDTLTGKAYWRILNSWGGHWGESGYLRILRGETIEEESAWCGWDNNPKAGTACKPYPTKQWVCGMCGIHFDSSAPLMQKIG